MNVFVTGADGMLGSNTIRELLKRKYSITVFLQEGRETNTLNGLDVVRTYGNILEQEGLNAAMAGNDVVIHIAANTTKLVETNAIKNGQKL